VIAGALTASDGEFESRRAALTERAGAVAERYPLYAGLGAAAVV
jgi:hypothetical protein